MSDQNPPPQEPEEPSVPPTPPPSGGYPPPPPPPGYDAPQGGYSPPPPGYPQYAAGGAVPQISNWLWQSIVATVLCCLPAGVVGIVYAAQVNGKLASGDIAGAQNSAAKAKMWTLISVGVGVAVGVIYLIIAIAAASASTT